MLGRFPLGLTNGHFGFPVWLTLVCFPLTLHNLSPIVKSLCIPHRFLSSQLQLAILASPSSTPPPLFGPPSFWALEGFFLDVALNPKLSLRITLQEIASQHRFSLQKTQRRRGFFSSLPARLPLILPSFLPPYFPPKAR